MPYKNKREKLATIEEERVLVRSLFDRFEDVFKSITKISNEEESEERSYVSAIVTETYGDVFRTIKWILDEENDVDEIWNFSAPFTRNIYKRWDELHIIISYKGEETVINGKSVPELWKRTLVWIEEHNLPLHQLVEEGFVLGEKDHGNRFAIALTPNHKNRKKFASVHTYDSILTGQTYYLETKINPHSGMKTIAKLLRKLGVTVETPLLNDLQ
ncbi:hypothetical protein [Bacillus sp. T3]|uniref:hypothetical protein n=1 Tax=Bacillus sp. T3 TaxID=467262 RepID=UPI00298273FC|nr:hypothetical protein [Bacillus sp. T3]